MNDLVSFLPIIDLNFSNQNCIYSRFPYICDQVNMLRVEVWSTTFDQPLRERSVGIFEEGNLKIICNRGVFTWWWASLEALKIWWKDLVLKIRSWKIVHKTLSAISWPVKLCQEPYAHSLLQKQDWCFSFCYSLWRKLLMTIRMKTKFQGLTNTISWYCQQGSIYWNKVIQIC